MTNLQILPYNNFNSNFLNLDSLPLFPLLEYTPVTPCGAGFPIVKSVSEKHKRVGVGKHRKYVVVTFFSTYAVLKFHVVVVNKSPKLNWTNFLYDSESGCRFTETEARLLYGEYRKNQQKISKFNRHSGSNIISRMEDGFSSVPFIFATFSFCRISNNSLDYFVGAKYLKNLYKSKNHQLIAEYVAKCKEKNPDWTGNFFVEPLGDDKILDPLFCEEIWDDFKLRLIRFLKSNGLNPSFNIEDKDFCESLFYCKFVEFQKDGTVHFHVIFKKFHLHSGICWNGFIDDKIKKFETCITCNNILTKLWRYGFCFFRSKKSQSDRSRALRYVAKYASKSFQSRYSNLSKVPVRFRQYSFSSNFPSPLSISFCTRVDDTNLDIKQIYDYAKSNFEAVSRVISVSSRVPHSSDPSLCSPLHPDIDSCHSRLIPSVSYRIDGEKFLPFRDVIWPKFYQRLTDKKIKNISTCPSFFCSDCGLNFSKCELVSEKFSSSEYILVALQSKNDVIFYYYSNYKYYILSKNEISFYLKNHNLKFFWGLKFFLREYLFQNLSYSDLNFSTFYDLSLFAYLNKRIVSPHNPVDLSSLTYSDISDSMWLKNQHQIEFIVAEMETYNWGSCINIAPLNQLINLIDNRISCSLEELKLMKFLTHRYLYSFSSEPSEKFYLALDLETTGLDYFNDQIIEISVVNNNSKFNSFVYCSQIPAEITKLTGIDFSMVSSSSDFKTVYLNLLNFLSAFSSKPYLVAHNVKFDLTFLLVMAQRFSLPFITDYISGFYDTLFMLPANLPNKKLEIVSCSYGLISSEEKDKHHRAEFDALITFKLFEKLLPTCSADPRVPIDFASIDVLTLVRSNKKLSAFTKTYFGLNLSRFDKSSFNDKLFFTSPVFGILKDLRDWLNYQSGHASTFLDAYQKQSLFSNFNTTKVRTGRFSASNPNLQNIKSDNKDDSSIWGSAKRLLRSSLSVESGFSYLCVDFSQQELRILSYVSNDKSMREAFDSGVDFHQYISEKATVLAGSLITRSQAKTINFSLIFGKEIASLAKDMRLSYETAEKIYNGVLNFFSDFKSWKKSHVTKCYNQGYIETVGGYKRYMEVKHFSLLTWDLIDSSVYNRSFERDSVNTTVQGTGADICKSAMIASWNFFNQNPHLNCRLVYQIHDEIIFRVPNHLVSDLNFLSNLKNVIENSWFLPWDLPVDMKFGTSLAKSYLTKVEFPKFT